MTYTRSIGIVVGWIRTRLGKGSKVEVRCLWEGTHGQPNWTAKAWQPFGQVHSLAYQVDQHTTPASALRALWIQVQKSEPKEAP